MTKQPTHPEPEQFYSITELAALFSVCRMTISRWIRAGILEAEKNGRQWRVSKQELRRLIKTEPPPPERLKIHIIRRKKQRQKTK